MSALQVARARSTARTEAHVAYRGAVANSEWEGLAVTIGAGDDNGGRWGSIGQPARRVITATALSGSATSAGISGSLASGFNVWTGAALIGNSVRIYRPVSGQLELIRTATITEQATDYWVRISPSNIITGTSFEYQLRSWTARGTYTFGVARINSSGLIGPVATVSIAVNDAGYTALTPATPTTGVSRPDINGRTGALAAVTGLAAQIRSGTTHNIELSWTGASPDEYVVFINWDGSSDRLTNECTITFASGPAVLTGDMMIIESAPILSLDNNWVSRRVRTAGFPADYTPSQIAFGYFENAPGGRTWEYVAYDGARPKPDITYPDYYLRLNGTASLPARAQRFFHAGTDQSFYDTLVPGRTYRAEIIASASSAMNATFAVDSATLSGSGVVALTTSPQTFTFDFTRASILKSATAQSWSLTGASNNVSIDLFSVRVWDTSLPYQRLNVAPPPGIDVRDHNLIKEFPPPGLDAITSRGGFGPRGWCLAALLDNCREFDCNPHFQTEWLYPDEVYYNLVTFLYAPASSGEPLALKREALGFGPVNVEFPRQIWESGNEQWNQLMWLMFTTATDSVTGQVYSQGDLSAMFAKRRREVMESNPYWPTVNPPKEFVGGFIGSTAYTTEAADYDSAEYTSVALYLSGWDLNRVLVSDTKDRWSEMLAAGRINHAPQLQSISDATAGTGIKLAIYEAGPGYQLNGLNGAAVTVADSVVQECFTKSVAGTTATMNSLAIAAEIGFGPYNFFAWGEGPLWQAGRPASEGGGFYRVAAFLAETHKLLGRSRVYATNKFINRTRDFQNIDTNGNPTTVTQVERAAIYHFESLDYPGRHGILYVNTTVNRDAFGAGHPDYVEGETGAAEFRYHTGLPASAVPFKVLRNEGNMRHHDAYKVGFRPNVVGSAIDGYVADPLCVDLTVTPEDFTVDDPTLRTLTLLGGNCRLEVFTT